MITELSIHNYKCFRDQTLHFRRLNILAGDNGSGKTAVLEALAHVWNAANPRNGQILTLNEHPLFFLKNQKDEDIRFSVVNDMGKTVNVMLRKKRSSGISTEVSGLGAPELNRVRKSANQVRPAVWHYVPLFAAKDRFGYGGKVAADIMIQGIDRHMLSQCSYLLNAITGFKLCEDWEYHVYHGDNPEFIVGRADALQDMGFGLRHTGELIRTCLTSHRGDTIILENPEVGLSEGAQSRLFHFLLHLASHGRQVFIETHSVFIFNALRVCAAKGHLTHEDYSVNYLVRDKSSGELRCIPVTIGAYGKCYGVFSQYEQDLDDMLGFGS